MARIVTIKPAEELVLIDPETKREYRGFFNMRCLLIFQELLREKGIGKDRLNDYDLPAMCLYAVLNTETPTSYEDACELSKRISPASGREVVNLFMESLNDSMTDKQRELLKKEIARYITQLQKK